MTARERSASLLGTVVGAGQIAGTVLAAPILRRRYNRWGATDAEVRATMAGDELVRDPQLGYTRAITIDVPPQRVWPWLAQIGQGRGGFYSYDGLENLARCDIHSADALIPEHQNLTPDDIIRLGPDGYPCFRVWLADAPDHLVLIGADPNPPHTAATPDSPGGIATWQFELRSIDAATRTRLLVRQRLTYPDKLRVLWHVVEPVGFVMERQMMMGIKARAEQAAG